MSAYKVRREVAAKNKFSGIKLLTTSALTAAGLIASGTAMAQNVAPDALPQGAVVTTGSADYDYSDARLDITQNNRGITSARYEGGFNIGNAATVNVNQVEGDTFVHVDTSGDTSYIEGVFEGDAGNIVLNRNGVLITGSARIDMNSFAASTAESVSFDGDSVTFDNLGDASIEIQSGAEITIAEGGVAAFVAPNVANAGVINAKLGKVAFAAGEKVTVDLYGDGLFEVEVEGELADAYLENTGEINAAGGTVQMTALAVKDVADNIINLDGVVDVSSATQVGGKIVLSGGNSGNVNVAGKADASGTDGGSIDITGQNITVASTAELYADGGKGTDQIGNGGRIDAIAQDHMDFRGELSARGGDAGGNGGNAEVSGLKYLGFQGFADLRAPNGDIGTLLMDPEFAVIHSGVLNNPLGQGYVLSAQALANSMEAANIVVQADNYIDVGTQTDAYNTGNTTVDAILNALVGTGDIDFSTFDYNRLEQVGSFFGFPIFGFVNYNGTTAGNITLQSDTVNFNKDVIMGDGSLGVDGNTVNLNSNIFEKDGVTALGNDRLSSNAGTVNVLSNDALIQQGIYLSDDAGGATVNVTDDIYAENLVIDRSLNLIGAGATIQGDGINNAITVSASNVNIDPFTIDAAGADYGIFADGASAIGFVSDGNTFVNATEAGIYLAANAAGTGQIINNTFEGSATRGVETGTLDGGYTLNILNNTIGTSGDEVVNGLLIGEVHDATLNITGGSIESDGTGIVNGDSINFAGGLFNNAVVNIANVTAKSGGDEAIDVQGTVRSGSVFNIIGGNFTGGANGVEFSAIEGDVTLTGITSIGETRRGLNLLDTISGNLVVNGGSITGELDGIGSNNDANTIDGGNVAIALANITGVTGKGISFETLSNNANLILASNTITGSTSGVELANVESGSAVNITGGSVTADGDAIHFGGELFDTTVTNITDVAVVSNNEEAIDVQGTVRSGAEVNITGGTQTGGANGVEFSAIHGEVNLSNLTSVGQTKRGLNLLDTITGDLTVAGGSITGELDGIGSNHDANIIDGGNVVIENAQITGTTEDGVSFEKLSNNASLRVDSNIITGSTYGVKLANVESGSTVDILNGTVNADGDAIHFGGELFDTTVTNITNVAVTSNNEEAIDVQGTVRSGAEVNITGGTQTGGANGVEFSAIHGEVNLSNLTSVGQTKRGLNLLDTITGDLTVAGGSITGELDGIGSNHDANNIDGGNVGISLVNITGTTGNGVSFEDVSNNGSLVLAANTVTGAVDGVNVKGDVDNSLVTLSFNDIEGGANGVEFSGAISNGSTVNILNNTRAEGLGTAPGLSAGVAVYGAVSGANTQINIDGNALIKGDGDGVAFTSNPITDASITISNNAEIRANFGDGVIFNDDVNNANVTIDGNDLIIGDDEAIDVENVNGGTFAVTNNTRIEGEFGDGIEFEGPVSGDVTISNNDEIVGELDGITFEGAATGGTVTIEDNVITATNGNGIDSLTNAGGGDFEITNNQIIGAGQNGIALNNANSIVVTTNTIDESGDIGLLVSGGTTGDVTLVGNTFTDNPTGARFESGNIDLTDLTDTNSFINTDPAGLPVGIQFDEVGIPGSLTVVGNTLGGTVFTGFNNLGSFYARIEDGTLLDTLTGEPIVIDAQNVNFDGFVPSTVGGILTIDQLTFLEDRLFDADDLAIDGRGQIFAGAVPELDEEDFIREFGFGNFGTSGLNLRIASLPAVDGTSLAAIQPAAGDETTGETGVEDLASIEPAAGEEGEDAACLGDAIASAGAGVAANFTFGGTFEESLADASACQSGIQ